MADISPTVVMSASQRAKKVSVQDDEPLAAWITEVVETLSRPTGAVRVAEDHVTDVREQLAELSETGGEVDPQVLEPVIEIFERDITSCRRLRPVAFSLFIEVLVATGESVVRARGLYILGKSLNSERSAATRKDLFQGRLDLIGQGCLRRLYDQFTEKSVPYNSRRWIGTLMLELIGECEDNQQIIALMPTTKRAKLGSSILYESSEILRSITGRIVTMILGAEHPIKQFFPPGTAEKLFEKYPSPAQSASQWDKNFQEYVDEIWEDICAENESNGELQFAQDIVTGPPHHGIKAVAASHRSIYIELGETLRIYIHSGKNNFDSAIDVPFASIGGIATALTSVDRAQQFHPVDVVLTIAPATPCFVNSLQSSLSILRLTVQDQEIADGIVDGISRMIAHYEEDKVDQQVAASSPLGTGSQGSSQGKVSCTEEDLVLDGSYTVVNDSFVKVLVTPANANSKPSDEIDAEQTIHDKGKMAAFQEKEAVSLNKQTGTNVADSSTMITSTVGKKKAMPREEPAPASRNMVEIDIIRDIDTGEVLTSKVLNIGVVPSKDFEVHKGMAAKPASIALESSDQLAGDGLSSSPDSPQEEPTTTEDSLEPVKGPPPPQKKQPLKSKAPIRGLKTHKEPTAEVEPRRKQDNVAPREKIKVLHPPQDPAEAPKKAKLVAPTKKPTKVTAKVIRLKRIEDSKDEDEIYNVSSSPPGAKKDTKTQMKGKKAAIPGMSARMPGGKRKGTDEGAEELNNVVKPKNPVSKAKRDSSKKKPVKKATLETTAIASRSKRASALRSTKGKKSMKDLSDSEIEELVVEEASIMERANAVKDKDEGVADQSIPAAQESNKQNQTIEVPNGVIHCQEEENRVKSVPRVQDSDDRTKTADSYSTVAKADQKPLVAPLVAKKNVIGQPITRQRSLDNEPDELQPQAEEQETSPQVERDESHDVFSGATVAASIEESDDLDMALPPTGDAQKPAGTVEAKIGQKMADIFKFASAYVVPDKKKKLRNVRPPQKPSSIGLKSSPPIEDKAKPPEVVADSLVAAPPSVGSDEIQPVLDGDEFIVLCSPPKIIETEMEKDISKVAVPSPAQEPIVVSDSDEESREPFNRDKISAEKRSLAAPSVDNPSERQRNAKPVLVSSSPLQPVVVRVSKRGAIKAKVQARKQTTPLPKGSPLSALREELAPSVEQSILVDDHQARKTLMIAFGPNGPRNQGLSSAVKPVRASKKVEPSTLSGIFEKLSKRSAEKKPSPIEQAGNMTTGGLRPQSQVSEDPASDDIIARFGSTGPVSQSNQDEGIAFFDAGQSVSSSRSHSRVDVNGSPQPKRASVASGGPLSRVAKDFLFAPTAAKAKSKPRRDTVQAEKNSDDGVAFDDDTTLFGSGFLSNRKVRPAPPGDELDFESRYTPHHSAENGTYVGVTTQNVVDAAAHITDPFSNKVKRQDSDFARRLRTAVNQEGKTAGQSRLPPTAKAQTRVQPPEKLLPHPSRLRSLVDADATLVNIENQPPRRSRRSRKEESSSDSTDSEADAPGQDEPATPTPQKIWREALKPHQQDVSDVLHHVVDGLLQQLFDKEPAIQAIAEQYRDNGTQIVEGLKSKMTAETQRLNAHATSTIDDFTQSLRQSRTALKASSGGSKELDDQYKAWRARQHDLQSLPFMARPNFGR